MQIAAFYCYFNNASTNFISFTSLLSFSYYYLSVPRSLDVLVEVPFVLTVDTPFVLIL